jgi:hypothetical protein
MDDFVGRKNGQFLKIANARKLRNADFTREEVATATTLYIAMDIM